PTSQTHALSLHDALPISRAIASTSRATAACSGARSRSICRRSRRSRSETELAARDDHSGAADIHVVDAVALAVHLREERRRPLEDRKSTRLNSSHRTISY